MRRVLTVQVWRSGVSPSACRGWQGRRNSGQPRPESLTNLTLKPRHITPHTHIHTHIGGDKHDSRIYGGLKWWPITSPRTKKVCHLISHLPSSVYPLSTFISLATWFSGLPFQCWVGTQDTGQVRQHPIFLSPTEFFTNDWGGALRAQMARALMVT